MSNARNRTGRQKVSNYREPSDGARRYSFSVNILCEQYAEFSGTGKESSRRHRFSTVIRKPVCIRFGLNRSRM